MFEFILYVSDQHRAKDFYSGILRCEPTLDVPGMTEFSLAENVKLGLMPENGIAKIVTPAMQHPSAARGVPRCELYLQVDDIQASFTRALSFGAKEVSKIEDRNWGDRVGYVADFDGHIIAFAQKIK